MKFYLKWCCKTIQNGKKEQKASIFSMLFGSLETDLIGKC